MSDPPNSDDDIEETLHWGLRRRARGVTLTLVEAQSGGAVPSWVAPGPEVPPSSSGDDAPPRRPPEPPLPSQPFGPGSARPKLDSSGLIPPPIAPPTRPPPRPVSAPPNLAVPRPPNPIAEGRPVAAAARAPEVRNEALPRAVEQKPEITQLLWYERRALPLVRRVGAWRALLESLERGEPDLELDDASFSDSPAEMEDRRDVFEVLSRGAAVDVAGVQAALRGAVRDDGKFIPPWILVEGDLLFPFDELATLESELSLVEPLASGDEKLQKEADRIRSFLRAQKGDCAGKMVEMLSRRLWEAFEGSKRLVQAPTLRRQAESMLLRRRRFQIRELFGAEQVRATIRDEAGARAAAYIPKSMMLELPLFSRFRARLIARVHPRVDREEDHATSLQVFALARRMSSLHEDRSSARRRQQED